MPELKINHEKINAQTAAQLIKICPFSAISYENGTLDISSACKMCKLCVRKGPAGAIEYVEGPAAPTVNKDDWRGIAVFADCTGGMKGSDCIIAVNTDKNAPIFDVAHYCIVGDLYEVLDGLTKQIMEERAHV